MSSQSKASGSQNTFRDSITLDLENPPISPLSSPIRHHARQQRQQVDESGVSIYRENGSSKDQQHKRQFSKESIMEEALDFAGSESAHSFPKPSVSVPLASAAAIATALTTQNDSMGPTTARKSGSKGGKPLRFRLGATPRVANPAPLGLLAYGLTAFCDGLYNVRAGGLSDNAPASLLVTTTLFYGGIGQVITGFFEFKNGNTFGGTVFLSYGLYWLSFASQQIPFFGMAAANGATTSSTFESDLRIQSGFLSLGWTLYTALLWSLTLRSNLATSLLFFLVGVVFLLQTILNLAEGLGEGGLGRVRQAEGVVSVIAGLVAWYCAMAQLSRKGGRKDNKKHGNSGSMDIEADARREEEAEEREAAAGDRQRWKETEQEDLDLEQDEVNSFFELPLGVFKK